MEEMKQAGFGLLLVEKNNKYGYVNRLGEEVFPPIFDYKKEFIQDNNHTPFGMILASYKGVGLLISSEGAESLAWYEIKKQNHLIETIDSLQDALGTDNFDRSIQCSDNHIRVFDNCNDISIADRICKIYATDTDYVKPLIPEHLKRRNITHLEEFEYEYLPKGNIKLQGYLGSDKCLDIPPFFKRRQVEVVEGFTKNNILNVVIIHEGITVIGEGAFYDCRNLGEVVLPSTIIDIGENAFKSCTNLGSINIPDSVRRIGRNAFSGCIELVYIRASPNKHRRIESGAFFNCNKLKEDPNLGVMKLHSTC
jgi:hypothetical protein